MTERRTTLQLLDEIADVGVDTKRGGFSRHVFDAAERTLRDWFTERAIGLGLDLEFDRNGNIWAWWGEAGTDAVVTGSHLDSVPGGGALDGPLGVASALDAVALMQAEGYRPARPFAIVVFAEEEGARFGVACLGSRLMTGQLAPERAMALSDGEGRTFGEAAAAFGLDVRHIGEDREALSRIGLFIELHVEQGRALDPLGHSIGVASSILEHGRWRIDVRGEGNHAGSTAMADRHDPLVPVAAGILAARRSAARREGARATVGKLVPVPGGSNAIASHVTAWLDVRSERDEDTREIVNEIEADLRDAASAEGCEVSITEESYSDEVRFDPALRDRLAAELGGVPALPTGAGHDAGVLAAHVPTAMLFVRNPTGVSHAPSEGASDADIVAGVEALRTALKAVL